MPWYLCWICYCLDDSEIIFFNCESKNVIANVPDSPFGHMFKERCGHVWKLGSQKMRACSNHSSRAVDRNFIQTYIFCPKGIVNHNIVRYFIQYNSMVVQQSTSLYWPVASFTKEVNQRLAKRPLVFNGRLTNRGLTSLVKEATGGQFLQNWQIEGNMMVNSLRSSDAYMRQ